MQFTSHGSHDNELIRLQFGATLSKFAQPLGRLAITSVSRAIRNEYPGCAHTGLSRP
jgi:hypothetical protein